MRVLLLVAHPDDEILFGARDLLENETTVLCFTNKTTNRSKEFEQSMKLSDCSGFMLDLPDSMKESWSYITDAELANKVFNLCDANYECIVSHDSFGEYGHVQHKRVHSVATYISKEWAIPFYTFRERYSPVDPKKRDEILHVYQSQKSSIELFKNFFH